MRNNKALQNARGQWREDVTLGRDILVCGSKAIVWSAAFTCPAQERSPQANCMSVETSSCIMRIEGNSIVSIQALPASSGGGTTAAHFFAY